MFIEGMVTDNFKSGYIIETRCECDYFQKITSHAMFNCIIQTEVTWNQTQNKIPHFFDS